MADLRHASWRAWRRTRPFWGGLLLAAAGVELIGIPLSGVLSHGAVRLVIYIGIGGVFGVLIGVLLIACGVAVCLNPAHRVFYGIAGVLLGILSFPASNLGGFFVGMLLAIVGGSMAFAWTLADQPPFPAGGQPAAGRLPGDPGADGPGYEPADELADVPTDELPAELGDEFEDGPPADGRPGGAAPGAHRQRMLAIAALPAIMLVSVLGTPGAGAATAAPQGSGGSCILIICLPGPTPTPSPSPGPSASPQPSAGAPGPGPAAGHAGKRGAARRRAAGGLVAATATSVITAGSATLDHLAYQGAANVPAAGGATVRMMKFTATSITLSGDVTASVTQRAGGARSVTTLTTSPALAFSGDVVLYATRLSGCLGPLCVTLTPDNAVTVLLRLASGVTGALTLTLTKVTTDQPLVAAGALQAGALKISFG
jgi:Family of unknown function (DUF6114)